MNEESKKPHTETEENTSEAVEEIVNESVELEEETEKQPKTKEEELQELIEVQKKEVQEWKEKYLRDHADLQNFKKRVNDERIRERKYSSQGILSQLLPIVDNFERAIHFESENEELNNFLEGIQMIFNQFVEVLHNEGVEEIKTEGLKFDPNLHQAVLHEEHEDLEADMVVEVLQKGYKFKDRVIRPAMVKVSK